MAGLFRALTGPVAVGRALNAHDDAAAGVHAQHRGRHVGGTQIPGPLTVRASGLAGTMAVEIRINRRIRIHKITFFDGFGKCPRHLMRLLPARFDRAPGTGKRPFEFRGEFERPYAGKNQIRPRSSSRRAWRRSGRKKTTAAESSSVPLMANTVGMPAASAMKPPNSAPTMRDAPKAIRV